MQMEGYEQIFEMRECPFCGKSDRLAVSLHQAQRYGKYDAAVYCRKCCAYGPRIRSEDLALPGLDLRNEQITTKFEERMKTAALRAWNCRAESGAMV